jgi:hypothetical protein
VTTRDAYVHVLPETSSEDRIHLLVDGMYEGCWCRPVWTFEGDGYVRIVHRKEEEPDDH